MHFDEAVSKMRGPRKYYLYEHWRPDRNECFYVGMGSGQRAHHLKIRNRWHKFIQGHLSSLGLCVEVRIIESGMTQQEAFEAEVARIAMWRADGAELVNQTRGGDGVVGHKQSREHVEKRAAKLRGQKRSPEFRAHLSKLKTGLHHTEATKAIISAKNSGRPSPFCGIPRTEEVKAKVSATKRKKRHDA